MSARSLPLLVLALCAGGAAAQSAAPPFRPTFQLHSRVQAERLAVEQAGRVVVRLVGTDPVREDRRTNLPDRVESGQTYRRVEVRFNLAVSPLLRGVLAADSLLTRPAPRPDRPSPR